MVDSVTSLQLNELVSLCKRRGFIFQSSEIYGGLGSTWDYGPLGVELKRNVKESWWRTFVWSRDDIVGLDASILMHPDVWRASGHVGNFSDPLVECKNCKQRFRADHVYLGIIDTKQNEHIYISAEGPDAEQAKAMLMEKSVELKNSLGTNFGEFVTQFDAASLMGPQVVVGLDAYPCPSCSQEESLINPRQFNLMFKTFIGPIEDDAAVAYLRPETAQGIFVNFNNVLTATRKKLPFGIAQIGKAFRNEITTGNFIFRTREFEIMEIEYFVRPGEDEEIHEKWIQDCLGWYTGNGLKKERLRVRAHEADELSHYAKATYDIEYEFPWGWGEIQGVANRTDFDLKAHSEASGESLTYFDDASNERFTPYVIEPAAGVDRAVMAYLVDAYREEEVPTASGKTEKRVVMGFHPNLAPVKVAILPLSRNERLVPKAREVFETIQRSGAINGMAQYDDAQSIGRRYRRQDEIGTPLCVTVDFDSLDDNAVTIRERDSMEQTRVPIAKLTQELASNLAR